MHPTGPWVVWNTNRCIRVGIIVILAATRPVETDAGSSLLDRVDVVLTTENKTRWSGRVVILLISKIAVIHEFDVDPAIVQGWQLDPLPNAAVINRSIKSTDKIDVLARFDRLVGKNSGYAVEEILIPFIGSLRIWLEAFVDVGPGKRVAEDGAARYRLREVKGGLVGLGIGKAGKEDEWTCWRDESSSDFIVGRIVADVRAAGALLRGWGSAITLNQALNLNRIFRNRRGECGGLKAQRMKDDANEKSKDIEDCRFGKPGIRTHVEKEEANTLLLSKNYFESRKRTDE